MGLKEMWGRVAGITAAGERKTEPLPSGIGTLFAPFRASGAPNVLPKATAASLRKFAETPAARRAINCIKNRVVCMDWQIVPESIASSAGAADRAQRAADLTRALNAPNDSDSFQTFLEQVVEDVLVGGWGAVEMEATGDPRRPVRLYPVDGATIEVAPAWDGNADTPRYAQRTGRLGTDALVPLKDDELMYLRLNPRTHSLFGLGKLEVAFETITQFLQAHRYAGKLAANSVAQYALWMSERTPEQQERLIRWWQDEVEGSGRVPVLTSEDKPEVLRFAGGTDADLHLQWQEFLLTMIANAFDLPPMLLGVTTDVNRSTASEMADEAFQNAIVPLAKLIAGHITRDVILKCLGWDDLRFVWSDLESRDESVEVDIQMKLLAAGVLSIDEVRSMRGLGPTV